MSTRSCIGYLNEDGSVNAVYCHYDGYPSWNGRILSTNYNTEELAKKLISMGDISSLRENLEPSEGTTHTFDNPQKNVTVFYHRDRGEEIVESAHFNSVAEYCETVYDKWWAEFAYLWDGNKWLCFDTDGGFKIELYDKDLEEYAVG